MLTPPLTILTGDALAHLRSLAAESVHACVTSPPYWGLRDYGVEGQLGLERTPDEYVARMVEVFREVRRVLRKDGTAWVNLGDSYSAVGKSGGGSQGKRWEANGADFTGPKGGKWRPAPNGLKPKDLVGIPWRVAFALQADGWYLRQDIIWHKPNPMPESVTDRCTKAHEYVFLLSKSERYYYNAEAVREPVVASHVAGNHNHKGTTAYLNSDTEEHRTKAGLVAYAQRTRDGEPPAARNRRSVWTIPTAPYKDAHFATFPPALVTPCVLAGCPVGGTVLDPFAGSGTTGCVALDNARFAILIELNPAYVELIRKRCRLEADAAAPCQGAAISEVAG